MLTSLRIQNFKAWRDTGEVRLAPLTVLFGSNSSGKSSLHQFLLLLRQTAESPDRRRVLHFGDGTSPVDLGAFPDVVTNHDLTRSLHFSLGWSRTDPFEIADVKTGAAFRGTSLRFEADVKTTGGATPRLAVEQFEYELLAGESVMKLGLRSEKSGYKITNAGFQPVHAVGRKWPVSAPTHFYGFPDDVNTRFQNLEIAADLTFALEEELRSLAYLGPLREAPERLYRWSGEEPEHVGWRGELSVAALLAGRDRTFNRRAKQHKKPLQAVVAQWLKDLGVIGSFEVTPIARGRDQYEVRVRTTGSASEVLLTDVGFGVSQVLPVVVECFYAAGGQTVIIEQPEIHLHPSVQANLADMFIDALKIREDGHERGVQFIVESHSEHFLRRLLRRIADETIDRDEVALYVARPGGTRGSRLDPLEVDEYGIVHNWPDDFFGDQLGDVTAQAELAVQRRMAAVG